MHKHKMGGVRRGVRRRRRGRRGRARPARAARRQGKTFYFIPKDTLNPYEVIADRGGKLALTELGDTQVVQSGTEDTAAAQQPAVQAAIQAHAAGIVIAGNDPRRVVPGAQAGTGGRHARRSRSTPT